MSLPLIILIQLFVYHVLGNKTEVNVEGCKKAITLGYGYKVTYHIREAGEHNDNQITFKFYTKAPSDAHILFSIVDNPTEYDQSYEIVLGGGKNTFSAIRRKSRNTPGAQATTPNILSAAEYRGFWIKFSSHGRIEIGKEGNEAPFLFWDDPHPLIIRYFAFCNWASYIGLWAYGCPNEILTEEVAANLTKLEKLRNNLLTHYDQYNRPVIQNADITTVYFQLQNKAVKLDEKQSKMSVVAIVHMQWQDQKLQWDPLQHGNISKLVVAYHEIWQPDLILYNAVGSGTGFLADEPMSVSPVGSVKWKTHINVNVHCNLDLNEWPYDKQVCELQLGFWAEQKYLKLLYSNEPEDHPQETNSEWQILNIRYENININTPWANVTDIPKDAAMAVRYLLQRNNYMYRAVFGVPLLAVSLMTLLPFWISPLNPNKLHISCLSLIVMSIFVVSLGRTLPAPANSTPVLVQTYSRGMVAIAFSILISVAIITIARSTHIKPIPQILQKVINGKYMKTLLFFSIMSDKDTSDYGNLLEADNTDHQQEGSNTTPHVNDIQEQWIILAQLIDRLAFFIYVIYLSTVFLRQI